VEEKKEFLPIGTLVRLKGGKRKLLIIGINQIGSNGVTYDYCSCMYPYGYLNSDQLFLFNNDKIEEIYQKGYSDNELEEYYDDVVWSIENEKEGPRENEK